MDRLPYGRLWAVLIVSFLISSGAMYEICVLYGPDRISKNPSVSLALSLVLYGVPVALSCWWWTRVLKRHGYLVPLVPVTVRRRAWVIAVAGIAAMAGIVALEMVTYAVTRSRALELGVAVVVGAPAMLVFTRIGAFTASFAARSQPPIPRLQLAIYPVLFVTMGFNLIMMVTERNGAAFDGVHEFAVAAVAFSVVSTPFTGFAQWKLYAKQQRAPMLSA